MERWRGQLKGGRRGGGEMKEGWLNDGGRGWAGGTVRGVDGGGLGGCVEPRVHEQSCIPRRELCPNQISHPEPWLY